MKNKRKGIVLAASILGSVAIVSTGFAAWVVTGYTTAEATGNIAVDTVQDDRYTITFTDGVNTENNSLNQSILFGHDSTGLKQDATIWLKNDDVSKKAVMSASFKVKVSQATSQTYNIEDGVLTGVVEVVDDTEMHYQAAAGLVEIATTPTIVYDGEGIFTVTVNATWGTTFEGLNPYVYYNNKTYTEELGQHALENLRKVEALSSVTYKVTLTAKDVA